MHNKKLIYLFYLAIGFIYSLIFVPINGYEAGLIEITRKNYNQETDKSPPLRIYENKEKNKYSDYYILGEKYKFELLDKPIWGFCVLNSADIDLSFNEKNIEFEKKSNSQCQLESKILRLNEDVYNFQNSLAWICSALLVMFLCFAFFKVKYILTEVLDKKELILSVVILTIIYCWTLLYYPVGFDIDIISTLEMIKSYKFNDWFTYVLDLYFLTLFKMGMFVREIGMGLNICFFIIILFLCHNMKKYFQTYIMYYFMLLVVLFPSVGLSLNFLSRDLLANLFVLGLAIFYYFRNLDIDNKKLEKYDYFAMLFAVLLTEIRREMLVTGLAFLILYLFTLKLDKVKKHQLVVFFIISKFFLANLGFEMTNYSSSGPRKMFATLTQYIGSMIVDNDNVRMNKQEEIKLEKFINLKLLRRFHTAHDVYAVHRGALYKDPYTKDDLKEIFPTFLSLLMKNWSSFISGRFKMFIYNMGYKLETTIFSFQIDEYKLNFFQEEKSNKFVIHRFDNNFYTTMYDLRNRHMNFIQNNTAIKGMFFITMNSFLFLLIVLVLYKELPISAGTSFIVIARLPGFFVLTPSAQFKYLFDVYLMGLIILPMAYLEFKKNATHIDIKIFIIKFFGINKFLKASKSSVV